MSFLFKTAQPSSPEKRLGVLIYPTTVRYQWDRLFAANGSILSLQPADLLVPLTASPPKRYSILALRKSTFKDLQLFFITAYPATSAGHVNRGSNGALNSKGLAPIDIADNYRRLAHTNCMTELRIAAAIQAGPNLFCFEPLVCSLNVKSNLRFFTPKVILTP